METGPKPGVTGKRVAQNVRTLRERVTVRELSERLAGLGRPILPSGITKIEQGTRRIDVDDLVALAFALDVTPNRLLLTADASDEETVALYPNGGEVDTKSAWLWASGEGHLGMEFSTSPWPQTIEGHRQQLQEFGQTNRPHDPPDLMLLEEMEPHLDKLTELARIVNELEDAGVSRKAAMNFVRWERLVNDGEDD